MQIDEILQEKTIFRSLVVKIVLHKKVLINYSKSKRNLHAIYV